MTKYLKNGILEYIKNNPGVESPDITSHFKLRVDITLMALNELIEEKKVIKSWSGIKCIYKALPDTSTMITLL